MVVLLVPAFRLASASYLGFHKLRSFTLLRNLIEKHFTTIHNTVPQPIVSSPSVFGYFSIFGPYSKMPVRTYSLQSTSGEWWGSSIPRDAEGNILVVEEIHQEYAACVYQKIKEEWPYYRQLVVQNKCRYLYACSDASIDDCHHSQTPGEKVCHCRRWKQLWDQEVFENYKVGGSLGTMALAPLQATAGLHRLITSSSQKKKTY